MKLDSLGLNQFDAGAATCHAVAPSSSARSSGQRSTPPPQLSSFKPRCVWYHSRNARSSVFALMNTPPIPVTLAMDSSYLSFEKTSNDGSITGARPSWRSQPW